MVVQQANNLVIKRIATNKSGVFVYVQKKYYLCQL